MPAQSRLMPFSAGLTRGVPALPALAVAGSWPESRRRSGPPGCLRCQELRGRLREAADSTRNSAGFIFYDAHFRRIVPVAGKPECGDRCNRRGKAGCRLTVDSASHENSSTVNGGSPARRPFPGGGGGGGENTPAMIAGDGMGGREG